MSAPAIDPKSEQDQRVPLPLLVDPVRDELARERDRLMREAGLLANTASHFKRPFERAFTRAERDHVTVLFGGLTLRHEELIAAGMRGLGYNLARLPMPAKADFQAGKEYGNNGQCNPTYFTVGNLVNHLKFLEKEGIPRQQILDNYVFFTAGSCGPCRFGMYEAEYRFALQNAGFDGFRVLLFKDSDGLNQSDAEAGLEMNIDF